MGRKYAVRLIEQFFRILAPSDCLECGSEGSLLCAWCVESALPRADSRCYRCNGLTKNQAVCPADRRKTPVRRLITRTEYSNAARELVHAMKFKYSGEAADLLARELADTLPALPPDTVIVYVPAITSHVRQRGFDHTKRIAAELSKLTGYQHVAALTRSGQKRQVGSSRRDRLTQLQGSFLPKNQFLIKDVPVLLVDDVVTTGATIEEAAKALKKAGAKSVDVVVFARAK